MTFGRWLHEACAEDCGVVNIGLHEQYDFPTAFTVLRHAAKHTLISTLMSCDPLCRTKGYTSGDFFYRPEGGAAGYKRHAIRIVPTPIYPSNIDETTLWAKGALHLILSTSSSGFTRLRLDPPPCFEGEAGAIVLSYVGDWEAVYESWNESERSEGPWPVALRALFRDLTPGERNGTTRARYRTMKTVLMRTSDDT